MYFVGFCIVFNTNKHVSKAIGAGSGFLPIVFRLFNVELHTHASGIVLNGLAAF